MIVGLEGKPGSGKSFYATKLILEALEQDKKVITNMENFSVRSYAWHLEKKTKGKISRYKTLENFKILRTKDLKRFWEIPKRDLMNSLIMLDEVMLDFFSRDWQKTGKELIFFFTQHRKYRTDLYYITQAISKVDGVLREMTQYYIRLRNTIHYRTWLFPIPKGFVVTWFYEDQETILKREWLRPDMDVFKYYDSWAVFKNDVIPDYTGILKPCVPEGRTAQGNVILFPGTTEIQNPVEYMACRLPDCPKGDCKDGCLMKKGIGA